MRCGFAGLRQWRRDVIGNTKSCRVGASLVVLFKIINDEMIWGSTISFKFLTGFVTTIIVLNDHHIGGLLGHRTTTHQQWSKKDMPPLQSPIFLHKLSMKVREEEYNANERNPDGDTEDASKNLSCGPFVQFE